MTALERKERLLCRRRCKSLPTQAPLLAPRRQRQQRHIDCWNKKRSGGKRLLLARQYFHFRELVFSNQPPSLRPTSTRNYPNTEMKVTIDETTLAVIKLEVDCLLLQQQQQQLQRQATANNSKSTKVTILTMANCLLGSPHVLDVHAQSRSHITTITTTTLACDDTDEAKEHEIESFYTKQRDSTLTKNSSSNIAMGRFRFLGRPSKHPRRQDIDPALQQKYELVRALQCLQNQPKADMTFIETWDDAVQIIQTVLELPPIVEQQQQNNDPDNIMHHFQRRIRDIHISTTGKKIGLLPSQHLFQKVVAEALALFPTKPSEQVPTAGALTESLNQQKQKEQNDLIQKGHNRASVLLQELSMQDMKRLTNAWKYGSGDDILAQHDQEICLRSSLQTLQPGSWLNDEVIHYFLNVVLTQRDEQMCKAATTNATAMDATTATTLSLSSSVPAKRRRSHFFKSFFMTKLRNEYDEHSPGQYCYNNVKRWSKKIPGRDIFALDKIFFPINQGNVHWTCAVAFIPQQRIEFYDSMGGRGTEYIQDIFHYLQDEHLEKKGIPMPNTTDWVLRAAPNTPRQANGFDCGVFTCMFCDFISMDVPLVFGQEHVTRCRQRIALAILGEE